MWCTQYLHGKRLCSNRCVEKTCLHSAVSCKSIIQVKFAVSLLFENGNRTDVMVLLGSRATVEFENVSVI